MPEVQTLSHTHESIMLWLLENPHRKLADCAAYFGYSQSWLSTVIHSDIFQSKLRARQEAVFVQVAQDIPAKLRGAADTALERLATKIETSSDPDFLLDATDKLLHRMGFAPSSSRNGGNIIVNQQNNTFTVSAAELAQARGMIGQTVPALAVAFEDVVSEVVSEMPAAERV